MPWMGCITKQFFVVRTRLLIGLGAASLGLLVGFGLILSNAKVLAATSAATPMNIYYGTTHTHTGAQNDHGGDKSNANDIFNAAKANDFDFAFVTEHSGPSGPYSSTKYYADAQKFAQNVSENGTFIGFAGYEYSENGGDGDSDVGHMTGYGTDAFTNASQRGMKFSSFMDYVASQNQSRVAFVGFNHPPAGGHNGAIAANLTPARRQVAVMTEAQRNVGYNVADESKYYKGMVAELDRGWMVAPTCGLDGHGLFAVQQKESSSKKPCRTGVLAPSLTRAELLEAFQQRRIYSSRDTNMHLKYSANGYWMGSEIAKPSLVTFAISVSDPDVSNPDDKIKKIEVIGTGGIVLASKTFAAHTVNWQPTVNVGSNSYMFVRVFNGERSAYTAVGAPVWFK